MSKSILIIDDDLDMVRLVSLMLQRQGFHIEVATNGLQGLDKAFENTPDLILLDIMMPEMDGYEVARHLRNNTLTTDIPILMLTAKSQLDDKKTGLESGANAYLTKPTHPSELQSHIKTLLARVPQGPKAMNAVQYKQTGSLIGLTAAQPGVGVSALASNLAASLSRQSKAQVILVELSPGMDNLGPDSGSNNEADLSALLSKAPTQITQDLVVEQLENTAGGYKVLAPSNQLRKHNPVDLAGKYEMIFKHLSSLGRYIVIDLGIGITHFVKRLLPQINLTFVVFKGERRTIPLARALVENLQEYGTDKNHIAAILNIRKGISSQMPWVDIRRQLGHPIVATFSPAPELFAQAASLKTPAVLYQPNSQTAQQFNKLVERILEFEALTA